MHDNLQKPLIGAPKDAYGSEYAQHVLELYKLYVEMADKISERRQAANTYFLSINTALVAVLGVLIPGTGGLAGIAWFLNRHVYEVKRRVFISRLFLAKKNRIFVAFAAEDAKYRDLLRGQARNENSPFDFVDMSVKEPWDTQWKTNCRTKIRGCDGVIASPDLGSAAYFPKPTLGLTVEYLATLKRKFPQLEVHLVGHSAGSILLGYMLDLLAKRKMRVASFTLFAPACTVGFAVDHYKPAMTEGGVLSKSDTFFHILTDEREQADSVGPYGKSLLYLVSRALETFHKTPLLGMAAAWNPHTTSNSVWNVRSRDQVKDWQKFWGRTHGPKLHGQERAQVWDGQGYIPLAHGSFDNDVEVMTEAVKRIAGTQLRYPIENLRGY